MTRTFPQPNQTVMGFVLPESTWQPPTELPDLHAMGVRQVAIDLETRDNGLRANMGAGWPMNNGYVCGVSVAWAGGSIYIPTAHPETECFQLYEVSCWLLYLQMGKIEFVTHNGSYDYGWLGKVPNYIQDTMFAAYMLDENRLDYSLDALCRDAGIPGKDEKMLLDAGRTMGFGKSMREIKNNMWRLPAKFVGPYAEQDAVATLALWQHQKPQIEAQALTDAYQLEMDLMPCCIAMRRNGVRIDTARTEQTMEFFYRARDDALRELSSMVAVGRAVTIEDVRSARWLEHVFSAAGLPFNVTEKNKQGQFQSNWMERHPHRIPQLVAKARGYEDAASKFCKGFLLNYANQGRLHADIHQIRDEDGGTRSYRFSYSDPPLQQMPSPKRDKEIGLAIRRLFLPEQDCQWGSVDYSQQEYRLMVHDAVCMRLPGAMEVAEQYRNDPNTDIHQLVADLTGLERKPAKDCNFAKIYGAGIDKFAMMINRPREEAEALMKKYDEMLPFPKRLAEAAKSTAARRGFILLLDGARSRFDMWEPAYGYKGPYHPACRRGEAFARAATGSGHPWAGHQLRRAYTHKAMNRRVQGSAARQTKLAMRLLWQAGIVPLLQLHDELNVSDNEEGKVTANVQRLMVEAVSLRVPMQADASLGPNWADQEKLK